MILKLSHVGPTTVIGTYTIGGIPNRLAPRMLFAHPDAARALVQMAAASPRIIVSDLYRSAEASLEAVRAGRGALMPGYSPHNYGLATDIAVAATMKLLGFKTKMQLDDFMANYGFHCNRTDHVITDLKGECHHYNFLGKGFVPRGKSTRPAMQERIQELYGLWLVLDSFDAQRALQKLRFYAGDIDGKIGPISKEAIRAFRRAWGLGDSTALDARTQRTLAFVAAEREIVPL